MLGKVKKHVPSEPRRSHDLLRQAMSNPKTLPPHHDHRTIILCFDGTQNKISDKFSNVAKLFRMLARSDRSQQLVYYQTGIGTYTSSKFFLGPISSRVAMTIDSMVASSIDDHVKEGYRYLMDNYVDGDRICIFGFSRGAHTAKVLAAMIHRVGLLPVGNYRHIKYAWEVYQTYDTYSHSKATEFKKSFAMEVKIEFVGIWDSVGSVGFRGTGCPFSPSNTTIKTFRHALALDERRARFQANTWRINPLTEAERNMGKCSTDVEEVWFVGCHSDVGGGNCDTYARHDLSYISLRWMVRQCFLARTGILFVESELRHIGLNPDSLYPLVLDRPPPIPCSELDRITPSPQRSSKREELSEEAEDLLDIQCSTNDELSKKPFWWILETMPIVKIHATDDGIWRKRITMNMGNPRFIACQGYGIKVHRTVKMKMDDPKSKYRPKAKFIVDPTWVA